MHLALSIFLFHVFYIPGIAQFHDVQMHDIHISNTEMEWKTDHIAISTRIFTDDLLNALIKRFDLQDVPQERAQSISLIRNYIGEKFILTQDGRQIPLQFEQLETGQDAIWCSFSVDTGLLEPGLAIAISNTILFELFDDQTNIMQVTKGKKKKVITFDRKQDHHEIQW